MILIDTSAWIEFLRDTGSSACEAVDAALGKDIATCDVVRMELLAGARDEEELVDLRRLVARAATVAIKPIHYEEAAALYRRGRAKGVTIRRLNDCLIAAVAIDYGLAVLHSDRDFEAIAGADPRLKVES